MAVIRFTYALKRFFPGLRDISTERIRLPEMLAELDNYFPGIRKYVLDDQGRLRQHVNIFINGELIKDRVGLSDIFDEESEIYIMQALSGGCL